MLDALLQGADEQLFGANGEPIGWLKECRRIFSRFEKTAKNFGAMIKVAFIQRYLKLLKLAAN